MQAISFPSGERACERIRSRDVISDRFQPSGGLRSGRLIDGHPLRSYFSVSLMGLSIVIPFCTSIFNISRKTYSLGQITSKIATSAGSNSSLQITGSSIGGYHAVEHFPLAYLPPCSAVRCFGGIAIFFA